MPETRRGAGKSSGGERGTAAGPAPASEAGPSQTRQETGSDGRTDRPTDRQTFADLLKAPCQILEILEESSEKC